MIRRNLTRDAQHLRSIAVFLLGCAALAACADSPSGSTADPTMAITSPTGVPNGADPTLFRTVEPVFERRCGSLDCHGTLARGLRIYSTNGLRVPNEAGVTPGSGATTADEFNANYASIIGLEPEKMNTFLATSPRTADDAYKLVILSKPLELEKHKGGPALTKGEPAEQCITTWLIGSKLDPVLCATGAKPL